MWSFRTVLAPVVSVGIDLIAQDLHVLARRAAVQLVAARLLAAQHVWVSRLVFDDEREVGCYLLGFLQEEEEIRPP